MHQLLHFQVIFIAFLNSPSSNQEFSMTKKLVLKVGVHDEKSKQKAMKAVSSLKGVESLSMDMKEKKLTVVGDVDPVKVVGKLKNWHTELVSVGPAKEPEKKKEEEKKVEVKKVEEVKTKEVEKKKENEKIDELLELYKKHYPYTQYYNVHSIEDDPNSCVIC